MQVCAPGIYPCFTDLSIDGTACLTYDSSMPPRGRRTPEKTMSKQANLIAVYRAKVEAFAQEGNEQAARAYLAGLRIISARIIAGMITM